MIENFEIIKEMFERIYSQALNEFSDSDIHTILYWYNQMTLNKMTFEDYKICSNCAAKDTKNVIYSWLQNNKNNNGESNRVAEFIGRKKNNN